MNVDLREIIDIVEKMQWQYDNDIANINDKKYHLVDKDLLKYIRYLEQENQALKDQIETMQINWKPAPIKNSETIVKTCKCGEKHYFTNCYNEVYDRQKELIDKIIKHCEEEIIAINCGHIETRSLRGQLKDILVLIKEYEDEV